MSNIKLIESIANISTVLGSPRVDLIGLYPLEPNKFLPLGANIKNTIRKELEVLPPGSEKDTIDFILNSLEMVNLHPERRIATRLLRLLQSRSIINESEILQMFETDELLTRKYLTAVGIILPIFTHLLEGKSHLVE